MSNKVADEQNAVTNIVHDALVSKMGEDFGYVMIMLYQSKADNGASLVTAGQHTNSQVVDAVVFVSEILSKMLSSGVDADKLKACLVEAGVIDA